MDVSDYLSADLLAMHDWVVPDLLPPVGEGSGPQLVFVFESPGKQEVRAGLPVVGDTGVRALRFLRALPQSECSLGRFVRVRHEQGDGRIAVVNVCNVPLQPSAFDAESLPALARVDAGLSGWDLLRKARRHWGSQAQQSVDFRIALLSLAVGQRFQRRVQGLLLDESVTIVPWGVMARRFCRGLSGVIDARIPHPSPSNAHWHAWVRSGSDSIVDVRRLFVAASSPV